MFIFVKLVGTTLDGKRKMISWMVLMQLTIIDGVKLGDFFSTTKLVGLLNTFMEMSWYGMVREVKKAMAKN